MKKFIFPVFLLILYSQSTWAQSNLLTKQFRQMGQAKLINPDTDHILKNLKAVIPANWRVSIDNNNKQQITIERTVPVRILFENRINAPESFESKVQLAERIKKYGKSAKSKFVFLIEPKWSSLKIAKVKQKNQLNQTKILDLVKKYHIGNLFNKKLARKGGEYFKANNPAAEKKIQDYQKEKSLLEKKVEQLPDYNTEYFSLFLIEKPPQDDQYHRIYPEGTLAEIFFIKNKLNDILEKVK